MKSVFVVLGLALVVSSSASAEERCYNIATQNWEECSQVPSRSVGKVKARTRIAKSQDGRCYNISTQNWEDCND